MTNQTRPTNKTIKSLAHQMFKGYFFEAVLVLIMIELIALVPGTVIDFFFSDSVILAYLLDIYSLIIRGPLGFATAIYFLCNFRNQRVRYNCLMYGFDYFIKSAAIYVFTFVLMSAGFFLFIVPGFIAMINYSQAMYILVDNPGKSPLVCMKQSKDMMRGHKMQYVSLVLSYWIPFVISRAPETIMLIRGCSAIYLEDFLVNPQILLDIQNEIYSSPWFILCRLLMILCSAYFNMGKSAFYDIISGNLIFADNPEAAEQSDTAEIQPCSEDNEE